MMASTRRAARTDVEISISCVSETIRWSKLGESTVPQLKN